MMDTVLAEQITNCTNCYLHDLHNGPVPGQINRPNGVLFIGEAPGHVEDVSNAPFVGQSGRYLRAIIKESKFDSRYVSFCNVISCRPPKNRDPAQYEITSCRGNLLAQINVANPKMIITLGKFAANIFTSTIRLHYDMGRVFFPRHDLAQLPLYHPAFVMRFKKEQEGKFKQAMMFARQAAVAPSRYIPETCRLCGKPVEKYDEKVLAYCKYHYFQSQGVIMQQGLPFGSDDKVNNVVESL